MKISHITISFAALLMFAACSKERETIIPPGSDPNSPTKFEISQDTDGRWRLLKEGEEFYINGAAANRWYSRVREFGGNVFRTYGTTDDTTPSILSEAYRNGLYVNMGLPIARERDGFDYDDAEKVAEQFEKVRDIVRRYRNHPAVMCWSIGNEIESMYTKKEQLWKAVNDIAAMIHEEDPNHPTTVALAGANTANIELIIKHAPEIDILSVNSYYPSTANVGKNMEAAGWDKPYMVTEFGPRGTWTVSASSEPMKLPWGALVEQTSTQKAEIYAEIMRDNILPDRANGCIGSFVFVWGYQNHGEVLTWYGLFDKEGNSFGSVDEMTYYWTGKRPEKLAPRIEDRSAMTMNGKIADDAIIVGVSSQNTASVTATSPSGAALSYKWLIYLEGSAASDGSLPDGISGLIEDNTGSDIKFTAPDAAGNYRLVVFVTDTANRKVASAVIPFKVE